MQYAKDNNILIVAAAGNEGNLISALGQASTKFDNIITVGAAENNYRAGYSSYGEGLDILAPTDIPETAETSTTETKQGTSIAAAKVTNTISQMWAANPSLNYQQIKNILLKTATDIDVPEWDERTGYGIKYTTPSQTTNTTADGYRNSKSQSDSKYGTGRQITGTIGILIPSESRNLPAAKVRAKLVLKTHKKITQKIMLSGRTSINLMLIRLKVPAMNPQ